MLDGREEKLSDCGRVNLNCGPCPIGSMKRGGVWAKCDMPMRLGIGEVCLVWGAERIWERAPGVIGGEFGWRLRKAAGGRSCVAMALWLRRYSRAEMVASGWLVSQLRERTYQRAVGTDVVLISRKQSPSDVPIL